MPRRLRSRQMRFMASAAAHVREARERMRERRIFSSSKTKFEILQTDAANANCKDSLEFLFFFSFLLSFASKLYSLGGENNTQQASAASDDVSVVIVVHAKKQKSSANSMANKIHTHTHTKQKQNRRSKSNSSSSSTGGGAAEDQGDGISL